MATKRGNYHSNPKLPKTFAITAAQAVQNPYHASRYGRNNSSGAPHKEFLECFDTYCQERGAEAVIQAIRGSYVAEIELAKSLRDRGDVYMGTPVYKRLVCDRKRERGNRERIRTWNEEHPDSIPKSERMHYFWEEIPDTKYKTLNNKNLNKKICLTRAKVPPQNEDPASGNQDLPQDYFGKSVIMPHPKQRFVSVAKNVGGKMPRLILNTGCCTYPNYNETNHRGGKASRRHQIGFCVVDALEEKLYLPRLVPARADGSFVDLGVEYRPGKDPREIKAQAMVLGDFHIPFQDDDSVQATFEMIQQFKPSEVYVHDLIDFNSIAHHNLNDDVWQMWLAEMGGDYDSLEIEVGLGLDFLKDLSKVVGRGEIRLVPSNHDYFVHKWLRNSSDRRDRKNARMGSEIFSKYRRGDSPLMRALECVGEIPDNVSFLGLTEDSKPWGYECSCHGHLGINGGRGTLKGFQKSFGKVLIGHTHQMEISGNSLSVGTNSKMPLEYQKGHPSKSLHGNGVIWKNGLLQGLPIIYGKWRP